MISFSLINEFNRHLDRLARLIDWSQNTNKIVVWCVCHNCCIIFLQKQKNYETVHL